MKTLKEIKFEVVLERLIAFKGNRVRTAKSLEVSIRALRLWIHEMKRLGMDVPRSLH
jgi:DNA-binding NtrC family response regulator